MNISEAFSSTLIFFRILFLKDIIEIALFAIAIYKISQWLSSDHTKNLLPYAYGYTFFVFITWTANLQSVSGILITYAPLAAIMFTIVHQRTLQKNFITLKQITPPDIPLDKNWIQLLVQMSLAAKTKGKSVRAIIEQHDSLNEYIKEPFILKTPINKSILTLLLESPSYDEKKMFWLTHSGMIMGINCTWQKNVEREWVAKQVEQLDDDWITHAIAYTAHSDALAYMCSKKSGAFTLIAQGKMVSNITAPRALGIMKKYLQSNKRNRKGGTHGDNLYIQETFIEQLQS